MKFKSHNNAFEFVRCALGTAKLHAAPQLKRYVFKNDQESNRFIRNTFEKPVSIVI